MSNKKKIRNRAFASDRPTKKEHLRIYEPSKDDPCHKDNMKHDYRFMIGDRLGTCSRCGSEILT